MLTHGLNVKQVSCFAATALWHTNYNKRCLDSGLAAQQRTIPSSHASGLPSTQASFTLEALVAGPSSEDLMASPLRPMESKDGFTTGTEVLLHTRDECDFKLPQHDNQHQA